ncbi:glutathione ABC transporter permease GsiD [Klebsiella pneumoniae]
MRLLNWRRQAALNAMPGIRPGEIHTPWHEFWRRFRRQPVAMGAGIFVLLLIAVAIVAPWIAPYDAENYFDYDRLNEGPSLVHWFGVDSLGRDIFSRVLVGAQISLAAGVLAVLIGAAIGTVLGLLAGYYEGWWDRLIMRLCDVLFAFPGILLAIAVVAVMGSGMANVIIAVAIFSIPAFARLVRGNTLVLKQQTFIESARSIGASDATILFNHILPGTVSSIVVYFTMRIGVSIISAASLSFLGLGAQPPTPEWGAMLNEARADMVMSPHVALFPAVAIFVTVLAFARLVRGNTLVLKQQTFIESARSIGASDATILFNHILPGTVSSIVVYFTMRIGVSIISAASLSFLGLGAQPPTPEWGAMLNEARADMVMSPHVALFPAVAIFVTVLAFNLLGDGLRDALDPKLKG